MSSPHPARQLCFVLTQPNAQSDETLDFIYVRNLRLNIIFVAVFFLLLLLFPVNNLLFFSMHFFLYLFIGQGLFYVYILYHLD